jgi:hypothetical protein
MKIKDLKNNVGGEKKEQTLHEAEQAVNSIKKRLIAFVFKHYLILATLAISIVGYFFYSLIFHTKEVLVAFLISGIAFVIPKIYNIVKRFCKKYLTITIKPKK